MKIAFTTEYSYPSKCGVWNTVCHTAKELQKKGHEIHIFSSNIIKGTSKKSPRYEVIDGLTYHRFPVLFKVGENGGVWFFSNHVHKIKPDLIHAHSFRHFHATIAPAIARQLGIPCYLTTHGPFLDDGIRRPLTQFLVDSYDLLLGKKILNAYTKVFAVSKWEVPFLITIGCKKDKIKVISNGFPKEFLKIKPKKNNNVLFMGRIARVKNLEAILQVAKNLKDINFTIYGPIEKGYTLTSNLKNVKIMSRSYDLNEEIKEFNKNSIFVLPSKIESIPLALLEALGAGLVCISSNTRGGLELIANKKNGFIFNKNNPTELEAIIKKLVKDKGLFNKISKVAKESVKHKTWDKISIKIEKEYKSSV